MWSNYFKIALRSLLRYRSSSTINVFGLSMGLACCILCYLHVQYELGYDRFHQNGSRVYRTVLGDRTGSDYWVKMSPPVPPLLEQRIPEIEGYARFTSVSYSPKVVVEVDGNFFNESTFMMADPAFLEIFSFPMLIGQAGNVLSDKNSIVISESISRKLFGDKDPMGRVIRLTDNKADFQVAGVVADVPGQSHLRFDYLISFENLERIFGEGRSRAWGEFNYFSYLLLRPGANPLAVETKIHDIAIPAGDGTQRKLDQVFLQPLHDIHFQFNRGNQLPSYDKRYIFIFSGIAIALLLIACINYINLAIALSIKRVKEIGIRKVVGAGKVQLALQFMGESACTLVLALALSLIGVELLLPVLNSLLESNIVTRYSDLVFISFLASISTVVALVSGSYLSFYANSYKTASILKGAPRAERRGFSLQNSLVLAQFSISLVLIISSLIISDQLSFIRNKNIGLDYQQVVNVPLYSRPRPETVQTLKEELRAVPGIMNTAASSFQPGKANWHQTVWWEGQSEEYSMYIMTVDKDFFETMDIKLVEGTEAEIMTGATTGDQYILNESAVKVIGWVHARGKAFSPFGQKRSLPVAGVIPDFNFKSLHHAVDPLVIVVSDRMVHNQLSIRIAGGDMSAALKGIEAACKKVMPDVPFEFEFLDDKFRQLYSAEIRLGHVISWLTVLSVVFSLMGLYGLLSFNIEDRTKEIAIRKALGVTMTSLLVLFSRKYFRLLGLGALVALPFTYFLINQWLENFSYKVDPGVSSYLVAYGIAFTALTAIILIKGTAFGRINPAVSLKYE